MDAFVGRVEQRRLLGAAIDRAAAGSGGWVLVTGDAGIGKTRLVDVALGAPVRARCACLWSAARETEREVPYRVWLPVLRALDVDARHGLLARLRAPRPGAGPGDRVDLHDDVTQLLLTAARQRPLVLVLEDLHWADADSVLMLETVAAAARSMPVLLVATSRVPVGPTGGVLRPDLHLGLDPLSPPEVAELARSLDAPAGIRADLHRRSAGNPLFVRELVRAAGADGGSDGLPPTLAATVTSRVAAGGPDAGDVAAAAAVLGEDARLDQLLAVAGGAPGADQPRHRAALGRLVDARLLVPDPGAALRYRFPHALLREAVLAGLPVDRRAATAAVAAQVLRAGGSPAGVVAPLLVVAASGGHAAPRAALDELRRAAQDAEGVGAWEQAVRLRQEAVEWSALTDGGGPSPRAVLDHAEALGRAGDAPRARARCLDAAALARAAGDDEALALAALGLSGGLGGDEVPLHDREQIRLLEEVLGRLPAGPLRAHVRARRSVAVTFLDPEDARAEEARTALAEAGDDDRATVAALSALADARAGPAHVAARLAIGAEMVRRAARAGSPEHELLGLRLRLVAELESGDVPRATSTIAAHGGLADRLGQARYRWYAPLWRAALALMRGDVPGARAGNAEAAALGARAGSANAAMLTVSQRAGLHMAVRDLPALRALLEPVLLEHPDLAGPRVAMAWVHAVGGDAGPADAGLERLVTVGLPALPVDAEWLPTVVMLADAVRVRGEARWAGPVLDALRPFSDLFAVDGIVDVVSGSVARSVAALTALAGDPARADVLFAEALRREEAAGAWLPAADTREAWGRALVRSGGDVARGRDLLRAATAWRAAAGLGTPSVEALHDEVVLARDGDAWEYTRGGRRARLATSRGLDLLCVLLRSPGQEVRAVDLDGRVVQQADLGPVLDAHAERAYRERVARLSEELHAAQARGDADRAAAVRREREDLERALAAALGFAGRVRPQGSSAERARTAVTKALRTAVRRLGDVDPLVGEHLAASVRTGAWCSYSPDPATAITWRVTG